MTASDGNSSLQLGQARSPVALALMPTSSNKSSMLDFAGAAAGLEVAVGVPAAAVAGAAAPTEAGTCSACWHLGQRTTFPARCVPAANWAPQRHLSVTFAPAAGAA